MKYKSVVNLGNVVLSTTCEPVNCYEPEVPSFGKITAKHFTLGSIANYSCMYGYMLVGNPSVECDVDSTWKGEIPECLPVDCGPLEVIVVHVPSFVNRRDEEKVNCI